MKLKLVYTFPLVILLVLLAGCGTATRTPIDTDFTFVTIGNTRGDAPLTPAEAFLDNIEQITRKTEEGEEIQEWVTVKNP